MSTGAGKTPTIDVMDKTFFQGNRRALFDAIDSGVIVLAGNVSVQRSNDASYAFEQEANFWYLTGINAANWWVIIEKDHTTLVAPDVDEVHRIFDGSLSDEDAKNISGADAVVPFVEGTALLDALQRNHVTVATLGEDPHVAQYDFSLNPGPVEMLAKLTSAFTAIEDCRGILSKLRAIKQPGEIEQIRSAIELTANAFNMIKSGINNYGFEYQIEADFSYYFKNNGAEGHAYDPIVAAGKNACTLHYGKNQDVIADGQFVLMDIGARVGGYAADITRTYAHGEISERQKAVHEAVEKAHHEIIALLKPGVSVKEYFDKVDRIMLRTLHGLELLKEKTDYRKYFPHSISHGLGIDVHDSLGGPETFQPGMILTVEPGIYIPEEGIGVRIEDDILISEDGNENLSVALPTSL